MEVSVIVPSRNGAATIGRQLDALAGQVWDGEWEVVVSDNGSTDATRDVVERYRSRLPRLRVVDSADRLGANHARNVGVAQARGASAVFCDDDDEVAPGWLAAMAEALRDHEFVAATLEFDKLNPAWARNRLRAVGLYQTNPPFLPYTFSAALGVRRSRHLEIGGFDEEFVGGAEDVDYCFRLQLRGVPLQLVPDAVVHYRVRTRLGDVFRQARNYSRGDVRLYKKYQAAGMRRASQLRALRYWLFCLPRLLLAIRSRAAFGEWLWRFGRRVGFLQGSLEQRVLAL